MSGLTVAGRALADGRPAVSSSFRFHRPRGAICGRGHCHQCEIVAPDGRRLACQTDAGEVSPRRDMMRPLGRLAERYPPWFYEHRFLWPRRLRGVALGILRHLSSAPRLNGGYPIADRVLRELDVGTVQVGGWSSDADALTVSAADGELAVGLYADRTLLVLASGELLKVRFDRIVLATGSYERLPPIPGNDRPGVIGLDALRLYAGQGAIRPGTRVAVWAPEALHPQAQAVIQEHGLRAAWIGANPPQAIVGRRSVSALRVEGDNVSCSLFVVGVRQPAIELALQGGAVARLSSDGLPILRLAEVPDWMTVVGRAAATVSGVEAMPAHDDAFACLCEDVRVRDIRACIAQGFDHPELVKRRTGAMTGPCQGKLCAAAVLSVVQESGVDVAPTRARPLSSPVPLGELAAHA